MVLDEPAVHLDHYAMRSAGGKMKRILAFLVLIVVNITGCATPATRISLSSQTTDSDLNALKGSNITEIVICQGYNIHSIENLKGLPLRILYLQCTKVKDLTPLSGMKLKRLGLCTSRDIEDLSPLKGMPLEGLSLVNTKVSDLSVVKEMPLKSIAIVGSNVTDISPLARCPLESIYFDPCAITNGMEMLRHKTTLNKISTKKDTALTPEKFWKKYDSGEFKK